MNKKEWRKVGNVRLCVHFFDRKEEFNVNEIRFL